MKPSPEMVRAARRTGLVYGTLQLASTFPSLIMAQLATDLDASMPVVVRVLTLGQMAYVVGAVIRLVRAKPFPERWRVGGSLLLLGASLVALGARPTIGTFAVAVVVAGAQGSAGMLIRQRAASRFPGVEGDFQAICQTWTSWAASGGAVLYSLAALGLGRWTVPTVLLGAFVAVQGALLGWGAPPAGAPPRRPERPTASVLRDRAAWRAIGASAGIYAVFQVLWSHLQPKVTELGFGRTAPVIVAGLSLARLVSLPWVRRYARASNAGAQRSALAASRILVGAAGFGLLTLAVSHPWLALPLLAAYTTLVEIGANSTSSAVTVEVSRMGAHAVLVSGLTRSAGAGAGGWIAAGVPWLGAVLAVLAISACTHLVLRINQTTEETEE